MEYFRILNLQKEPFSNSPEPDFFFLSSQHRACLQHLELAVRLHRGLNVVIGDVGTGKTTLCRRLIMSFAHAEQDENPVHTHLIMDPAVDTTLEFLRIVAASLGLDIKKQVGERCIKEKIKNYLFENCVDKKQTVLLIIDEGQKLPDSCLEILREFLNYETNHAKLLQIVIFAQKEFQDTIEKYPNFKDRVNRFCFLEPLSFRETCDLISYRLKKAGNHETLSPEFFTLSGLWAVYHYSGGYPRKIVTLCHQVMLSLIIQNKAKADFFLIRACAKRVVMETHVPKIYRRACVAAVVLLALIGFWTQGVKNVDHQIKSGFPPGTVQLLSGILGKGISIGHDDAMQERPVTLGVVRIGQGYTVNRMLQEVYGNYDDGLIRAFRKLNPHIADINKIQQGDSVKIPALPTNMDLFHERKYLIRIAAKSNLNDALDYIRVYPQNLPPVKLLPYWNRQEGLVFAVTLTERFSNLDSALAKKNAMSSSAYPGAAEALCAGQHETEFYVR
ncbi:MAG TPA: AAA family ATPase [Smithellaceae bacterium]|nr:AAA family ATPase [Smithellaceae bacterium]